MQQAVTRIFSIDDLGRHHDCSMLLDQNLANPAHRLYPDRTPSFCKLLLGPNFALLRPTFATLRPSSLKRPRRDIGRLLVFMGGNDIENETLKALNGIAMAQRATTDVDVVIGEGNPHRASIAAVCATLKNAHLHIQTPRMAELMAQADLAIGAGGSTTWERCTLGLPALVSILADNQTDVAVAVAAAGGHRVLGRYNQLSTRDYAQALDALEPGDVERMATCAAEICDGLGTERIVTLLAERPAAS